MLRLGKLDGTVDPGATAFSTGGECRAGGAFLPLLALSTLVLIRRKRRC